MKNLIFGVAAGAVVLSGLAFAKHSEIPVAAPPTDKAPEAAACTFDDITRECAMFDPKITGPRIKLPDGTFIPNYAYNAAEHAPKDERDVFYKKRDEATAEAHKTLTQLKKVTFKALAKKPGKTSLGFQLALSNLDHSTNPLSLIFRKWATKTAKPEDFDDSAYLPWPPDDEDASPKYVSLKEIWEKLDDIMGEEGRTEMAGVVKKYDELRIKVAEANLSDEQREARVVKPERARRVAELFTIAQKKLENVFSRGRPEKDWSPADKRAIEKLRLVKMLPPSEKVRDDSMCRGAVPNAWYTGQGMTISACPAFFNFPDATIMGILGHELGHAVDPCNAQCGVCTVDVAAMKKKPAPPPKPEKEDPERIPALDLPILKSFDEMGLESSIEKSAANAGHLSIPLELDHQKATIDKYVEKGAIKKVIEGTPHAQYPLKDVYECLKSEKGGGFRAHSEDEVAKIADAVVKGRGEKIVGKKPFDPAEEKAKIKKLLNLFPECVGVKSHSHMGEALADWMGANVLGSFLKDEKAKGKKLDTPEAKLSTIGFFASTVCAEHFRAPDSGEFKSFELAELRAEYEELNDPHPGSKNRMENIFLRDPLVLEALDCPPNPSACLHAEKKEGK